jgi:hypothetical protein
MRPRSDSDQVHPSDPGRAKRSDPSIATVKHHPSNETTATGDSNRYSPPSPHRATDTPTSLTPSQQHLVDWARERFAAGGLTPPSPDIVFTSERDDCQGRDGLFQSTHHRISICISDSVAGHIRRKLMLHELAHDWARQHLTAHDRDTFVELRGAASWNDRDDPWAERATEHAAEILAWGLLDIDVAPNHIQPTDNASLRQAFITLTGLRPINDGSHPASNPTEPAARATSLRT